MIKLELFFELLKKKKINFFTGVPDSILKDLNEHIINKKLNNITVVNEGSAIGLGVGYYLSKKKIPAIYLQNSGLGNAINPIVSIAHKKVYSIPCLLIIGWRGAPNSKDEPQHLTKGLITRDLLKLLGIKYCELNKNNDLLKFDKLIDYAKKNKSPVACLIKKNTFVKKHKLTIFKKEKKNTLKRDKFITELLKLISNNTKIVSSTGYISRELFRLSSTSQRKKNFYVVGGMGHCSMIAMGYSLYSKKNVLCLDGDGSMLMHFGNIFTISQNVKKNFKYILLNNNAHESVGGQATNINDIDLKKITQGLNFKKYFLINNNNNFISKLKSFLNEKSSSFLEVKISKFNYNKDLERPNNLIKIKNDFMK
jgi:phosphonopyruvate decarboxylase